MGEFWHRGRPRGGFFDKSAFPFLVRVIVTELPEMYPSAARGGAKNPSKVKAILSLHAVIGRRRLDFKPSKLRCIVGQSCYMTCLSCN